MTNEDVEERCLDADVWADELEGWAESRANEPAAEEASAMARMLRAMAKSIRLAVFADSADEASILVEELENLVREAQAVATGTRPQPSDALDGAPPALLDSDTKPGSGKRLRPENKHEKPTQPALPAARPPKSERPTARPKEPVVPPTTLDELDLDLPIVRGRG